MFIDDWTCSPWVPNKSDLRRCIGKHARIHCAATASPASLGREHEEGQHGERGASTATVRPIPKPTVYIFIAADSSWRRAYRYCLPCSAPRVVSETAVNARWWGVGGRAELKNGKSIFESSLGQWSNLTSPWGVLFKEASDFHTTTKNVNPT